MAATKSVLVIGLVPELVDFTPFPGMSAEKIRAGIAAQLVALTGLGFAARHVYLDMGETAESVLEAKLAEEPFDCICVGAGLRLPPAQLPLFEKVLNVVHRHAPRARICFNTSPADTVEAVKRWT